MSSEELLILESSSEKTEEDEKELEKKRKAREKEPPRKRRPKPNKILEIAPLPSTEDYDNTKIIKLLLWMDKYECDFDQCWIDFVKPNHRRVIAHKDIALADIIMYIPYYDMLRFKLAYTSPIIGKKLDHIEDEDDRDHLAIVVYVMIKLHVSHLGDKNRYDIKSCPKDYVINFRKMLDLFPVYCREFPILFN